MKTVRKLEARTTMVSSPPPPGQAPCPCGRPAYATIRYGHGVRRPHVWTFCDVHIERAWRCKTVKQLAELVLAIDDHNDLGTNPLYRAHPDPEDFE